MLPDPVLWTLERLGHRDYARRVWDWWEVHWLRTQSILTPTVSSAVAFAVSRAREGEPPGVIIGIADSASAGVLFYTASFATLEGGIWLMVLARQLYRKMEADRIREAEEYDRARRQEGIALALGAVKGRPEGETPEQAIERLQREPGA